MESEPKLAIDYIEIASPQLEETQAFMARAFGWDFIEYGPDYRDIQGAGIGGGIERAATRPPLVVLKADDLEAALQRIRAAGAKITHEIFDFPGGRRFQFIEPGGTEMAVWSET
ncbi:VOC family protein [Paracoccus tegillarcae]|uniref:Glyoxalase family protein n=1 Tax=Paracoccus tegillarcae TaxID=1529068 RepID=A0A2K9F4Z1_9RHOB|nr:VOC family protein [Paracoccus tegillarcae]AUH35472.1 glyoxalase family protein [Paracoccus tegillarcae]